MREKKTLLGLLLVFLVAFTVLGGNEVVWRWGRQWMTERILIRLNKPIEQITDQITVLGGKIINVYDFIPYAVAEIPKAHLNNLKSSLEVSPDRLCRICLDESVPIIKDPERWSQIELEFGEAQGEGIKIAILDTGIDSSHPDLDDLDDNPLTYDPKVIINVDFTNDGYTWDGHGHGTHVASIAAGTGEASNYTYVGVAPGAYLMNIKVLNASGVGYESWIINGIQYAVEHGADIISMSFGADENTDGTDPLSEAVDWAVEQGVVCVVAAGNRMSGMLNVGTPACSKKAITVGSSTKDDDYALFSSRGPTADYRIKPDVLAPGENIIAARASGTNMGTTLNDYYTMASGTSMATPHVSGACAILKQLHPDWTPEMIKAALMGTAKDLGLHIWEQGAGRIDICDAVNTTLISIPPSVSFGVLNQTKIVDVTVYNLKGNSVEITVSTPDWVQANVSQIVILDKATIRLTANYEDRQGGWLEGTLNLSYITVPLLAGVSRNPIDAEWFEVKTLNLTARSPARLELVGDYLFAGCWDRPGILAQINLETENITYLSFEGLEHVNSLVFYQGYLYVGFAMNPGVIAKVNVETMEIVSTVTLEYTNVKSLVVCKGYLFAGMSVVPGVILKIDPETLQVLDVLQLRGGESSARLYAYNGYVYAGVWFVYSTKHGRLLKIDPETFQIVGQVDFAEDERYPISFTVADNGKMYIGLWSSAAPGRILEVDPETLEITDRLVLGVDKTFLWDIVAVGDSIYASLDSAPGRLLRILTNPLREDAVLNLTQARSEALVYHQGYLYTGCYTGYNPGVIVKTRLPQRKLTVSVVSGEGTTSICGTQNFTRFTHVSVYAIPGENYTFAYWLLDGHIITENPVTVYMNTSHTLQAVFTPVILVEISASAGGTTDPAPGTYAFGEASNITLTAIPDPSYKFVYWDINGIQYVDNPLTILITGNTKIKAVFEKIQYNVTISATPGGQVNPAGKLNYPAGTLLEISATADNNYHLAYWIINNQTIYAETLTIRVNQNYEITAVFEPNSTPPEPQLLLIIITIGASYVIIIVLAVKKRKKLTRILTIHTIIVCLLLSFLQIRVVTEPENILLPNWTSSATYVFAYYPAWGTSDAALQRLKNYQDLVTHVVPTWLSITEAGSVVYTGTSYNSEHEPLNQQLRAWCTQNNIPIIPLLQNWNPDIEYFDKSLIQNVLDSEEKQWRVVNESLTWVREQDCVGIAVDFENIPVDYSEKMVNLLAKFWQKFKVENNLMVVMCVPAQDGSQDDWSAWVNLEELNCYVDVFLVMTYDYAGPWDPEHPNPIAPAPWVEKCIQYALEKVAPEKICLGIPTYAYYWCLNRTEAGELEGGYQEVMTIKQEYGGQICWNESSKTPYLLYQKDGLTYIIHYNDHNSIHYLIDIALKYQLAGVHIWKIGDEEPTVEWRNELARFLMDP